MKEIFSNKRYFVDAKWWLKRLPHALQYYTRLYMGRPVEELVEYMPNPSLPKVYWGAIGQIPLHGSIYYPPEGRVCMGGEWDRTMTFDLPSIFTEIPKKAKKWDLHETVRQIFIYGEDFRMTPQYLSIIDHINKGLPNPPQGCDTVEKADQYFLDLIKAYRSMKLNGYLTQNELGKSSVEEIRLHVTRDGKLCLGTGGNHRIRMAEILGIKNVPFIIKGVHPDWVIKLSRTYNLPPHQALRRWLESEFSTTKPKEITLFSENFRI
ncbi:hypothetical protein [Litoribacter populi]|uniref:hypothetical protein n=1 Tax=Litoribacter populi TaxID=2598460 RepID=UPI00117BFB76|nr:hypothetical protein [Litoribacter populi]